MGFLKFAQLPLIILCLFLALKFVYVYSNAKSATVSLKYFSSFFFFFHPNYYVQGNVLDIFGGRDLTRSVSQELLWRSLWMWMMRQWTCKQWTQIQDRLNQLLQEELTEGCERIYKGTVLKQMTSQKRKYLSWTFSMRGIFIGSLELAGHWGWRVPWAITSIIIPYDFILLTIPCYHFSASVC